MENGNKGWWKWASRLGTIRVCSGRWASTKTRRSAHKMLVSWFVFGLHVFSEWAIGIMPEVFNYPRLSIRCVGGHEDTQYWRGHAALHIHILSWAERRALQGEDPDMDGILGDIHWRHNKYVCLFLHAANLEASRPTSPLTRKLATQLNLNMSDEQAGENIHQHIRDTQRCRWYKSVPLRSRQGSCSNAA